MALSSVIGQIYARKRLGTLFTGGPGHAYVLTGPSGIGKTMLAKEVCKGLLCSQPTEDGACGHCSFCLYFDEGCHPDFRELALASGEKTIRVADVRSRIGADVNILPQLARRKVYLIDADGLNEEGQNALLKTLEEPPPSVVFVLTVADTGKLLKTIVSRAVVIHMSPNSEHEILSILQKNTHLEEEDALFFARYANGIPGLALELAQSQWFSGLREETSDLFFLLPTYGKSEVLTTGYSYFDANKDHIQQILVIMQLILRDMMLLIRSQENASLLNEDKRDKMVNIILKNTLTSERIEKASKAATHAAHALSSNCSFESTICQMLLTIQKELKDA